MLVNNYYLTGLQVCGLPGMPCTESGAIRKAKKENWQSRPRSGRGGGLEYQVPDRYLTDEFVAAVSRRFPSLPLRQEFGELTRAAQGAGGGVVTDSCTASEAATLADEDTKTANLATSNKTALTEIIQTVNAEVVPEDSESSGMWARQEIVRLWKLYIDSQAKLGIKEVEATGAFCRGVQDGAFPIPDWVRDGLKAKSGNTKISRASLHSWQNKTAGELSPKHKGKDGQSFFESRPEYVVVAEAIAREFGATPKILHFAFTSGLVAEDTGLEEIPTIAQCALWLRKRQDGNGQRAKAFATGDKSIIRSAMGSYSRGLMPNDKWEIDSTKADMTAKTSNLIWLSSRLGEAPVRCNLTACIDVATRRAKLRLSPTSNGEAIALLTAECIGDWGKPKLVKTDNGRDYIGKYVQGFYRAMGIGQQRCTVECPWEKPHVERLMKSLQHSEEWEMLPWNTGHNVAQIQANRKKLDGEKLLPWTIEEFQGWLDRWCENYHNTLHENLGCTPNERLAAFREQGWRATMPRNLEKNLEFALLREELATVNKGGISYSGRRYIAPELHNRVGDKVAIRIDTHNPNQIVVYDNQDLTVANLICVATWDLALTPEEQARIATAKPVISQALLEQEQKVKQVQRKLKRGLQANPHKLLPDRGGKVMVLAATQEIEAITEGMVQQIEAATAAPATAMPIEERKRLRAELNAPKVTPMRTNDQVLETVAKCCKNGEIPTEGDYKQAERYLKLPDGEGALIFFVSKHKLGTCAEFMDWFRNLKTPKEEAI